MPRTRSLAWSELRIGVVTIVALGIAAVTVFMLTGDAGFPWQQYTLKTRFSNVAGLKSGSPVRVAGMEVGTVQDVVLTGDEVEVTFEVNRSFQPQITTGSVARLGSVSLLGEAAVDITPSTAGSPLPEWDYVPSGPAPAQISDITDQAGRGIGELTSLISEIRAGRGTMGKLVTDDQLYTELQRFATTAGDLAEGIRSGRGSIGKLLNDPATANALEASLTNIESLTRQINAGEGSLGKLLKDDAFATSLSSATTNLDRLVTAMRTGDGTVARLVNDPALFNRLNSLTERIDALVTGLSNGEGTAGQLLKDRQLYENMNKVTNDLSSLIAEIKKDPKKYLNVRISIF